MEALDQLRCPVPPVADHQSGEIDGHEPARADDLSEAEGEEGERHGEDGVEACGELEPVDQPDQKEARPDAEHGAADDLNGEIGRQLPGPTARPGKEQLDAADGEEDGHRVVDRGFDLEQAAHPWLDVEPVQVKQEEHGCRVGRADDRADQHAFDPAQPEEQLGRGPGERRGQGDADRGQQQRRPGRPPEVAEVGAQAAVEQDDGERDAADGVGGEIVVEENLAGTVLAEEDAETQEGEQQRRPDAGRDQAYEDAEEQQERSQQDQLITKLHRFARGKRVSRS